MASPITLAAVALDNQSYLGLKEPSRRDLGKVQASYNTRSPVAILDFVGKVTKAHRAKSRTLGGDSPFPSSLSVGSSGVRNEMGHGSPE